MLPGELREDIIGHLRWLTDTFGRLPEPPAKEEEQESDTEEEAEEATAQLEETLDTDCAVISEMETESEKR